jgi:hypothetical protein
MRAVSLGASDPDPEIGLDQIEVARDARNALALVEHEPDRLRFEVVIESPAGPALGCVCHRSGHRIHLSEDVHETESSPLWIVAPLAVLLAAVIMAWRR